MGIRHQSFLEYKRYRYLKWAFWFFAAAVSAYVWHRNYHFHTPGGTGYGGTWMGYTLGSIAAMLVLWLLWLGVRKRRYSASRTTVQGWLSAHVYLGVVTLIVALMHSGFEFGFNLHSLTMLLLGAVVASGIYGVLVFVRIPSYMTAQIGQDSLKSLLLQIQDIDQQARKLALQLSDDFNALVLNACEGTNMSGSFFADVILPRVRQCPTDFAVDQMQVMVKQLKNEQARLGREVFTLMVSRQAAVQSVRRELRALARLKRWLLWHVPMSIALLFALTAHIVSVFIYW